MHTWMVLAKWLVLTRGTCDSWSELYFSVALGSLYGCNNMEWMGQKCTISPIIYTACKHCKLRCCKAHNFVQRKYMQCLCTLRRTTLRRVLQIEENKYTIAINIGNSVILSWCTKHVSIGTCYCPIMTVTDTSSCKWQLHKDNIPNRCLCRMDRSRSPQRDS